LAMLAYNLNCWLMLFHREEQAKVEDLRELSAGLRNEAGRTISGRNSPPGFAAPRYGRPERAGRFRIC